VSRRQLLALPAALLLAGCGVAVGVHGLISGTEVGVEAEKVVEKQPDVQAGTMTCGSLRDRKGDSTRCTRVVDKNGTVVKVGATVTLLAPGRPHQLRVVADPTVQEFGLNGDVVEKDLAQQYAAKYDVQPDDVSCPYLRGIVGTRVTCKVTVAGQLHDVLVTVDRVDSTTYDVHYVVGSL
jgi:hypothetical protein